MSLILRRSRAQASIILRTHHLCPRTRQRHFFNNSQRRMSTAPAALTRLVESSFAPANPAESLLSSVASITSASSVLRLLQEALPSLSTGDCKLLIAQASRASADAQTRSLLTARICRCMMHRRLIINITTVSDAIKTLTQTSDVVTINRLLDYAIKQRGGTGALIMYVNICELVITHCLQHDVALGYPFWMQQMRFAVSGLSPSPAVTTIRMMCAVNEEAWQRVVTCYDRMKLTPNAVHVQLLITALMSVGPLQRVVDVFDDAIRKRKLNFTSPVPWTKVMTAYLNVVTHAQAYGYWWLHRRPRGLTGREKAFDKELVIAYCYAAAKAHNPAAIIKVIAQIKDRKIPREDHHYAALIQAYDRMDQLDDALNAYHTMHTDVTDLNHTRESKFSIIRLYHKHNKLYLLQAISSLISTIYLFEILHLMRKFFYITAFDLFNQIPADILQSTAIEEQATIRSLYRRAIVCVEKVKDITQIELLWKKIQEGTSLDMQKSLLNAYIDAACHSLVSRKQRSVFICSHLLRCQQDGSSVEPFIFWLRRQPYNEIIHNVNRLCYHSAKQLHDKHSFSVAMIALTIMMDVCPSQVITQFMNENFLQTNSIILIASFAVFRGELTLKEFFSLQIQRNIHVFRDLWNVNQYKRPLHLLTNIHQRIIQQQYVQHQSYLSTLSSEQRVSEWYQPTALTLHDTLLHPDITAQQISDTFWYVIEFIRFGVFYGSKPLWADENNDAVTVIIHVRHMRVDWQAEIEQFVANPVVRIHIVENADDQVSPFTVICLLSKELCLK